MIDLTDIPIKTKNSIYKVPSNKGTFKNVPDGISINPNTFNRVKLKIETVEMGTQTETEIFEILPLSSLNLIEYDKDTVEILIVYFDMTN